MEWWQEKPIYQLLVPSFMDTDGDGLGDLPGIVSQLDYLQWLGVGALWLSPFYPTGFVDMGYDVCDFTDVDGRFGSLQDFDELLAQAHRRGLRVLLDWVPNHTSDQHPWFLESRAARDSARRDWYLWRDGRDAGSPPNNWLSVFGGSVWTRDEHTQQYYMHSFSEAQPDLNWRNPEVQAAMFDTLRFWLDRGVDGFRIDGLSLVLKDPEFRDNPPNPGYQEGDAPDAALKAEHTRDQPGLHELVARLRALLDDYQPQRILLGELYLSADQVVSFYGSPSRPELHLPLNLSLTWTDWQAQQLGRAVEAYEQVRPAHGWPTFMLSTHDSPRIAARAGARQRKLAAMLLLTLPGTPTLYYGEEVGMQGVPIAPDDARDPQGRHTGRNRDPERTPMQWNGSRNAGFSHGEPWLPVGEDYRDANVAAQGDDADSLLNFYRRMIALRGRHPVLIGGRHDTVVRRPPLLTYTRSDANVRLFVALNLGDKRQRCELDAPGSGRLLVSTHRKGEAAVYDQLDLRPGEGVVVLLD